MASRGRWMETVAAALLAVPCAAAADLLRGRVLLDDVIPPSAPIAVKLLCNEETLAETTADPAGWFAIRSPGSRLEACRLTASAPGYEPDQVPLEKLPRDPAIGALVLQRSGKWNGYALSSTSLAVDAEARSHFETAVHAMRQGGQDGMARAEEGFALAVQAEPGFAEAWYQLGRMRLARQDAEGGREALERALEADSWYLSPYRPLLLLELGGERWQQAAELSARLLELSPYLADIRYYRGLAMLEMGNVAAAEREVQVIAEGPEAASFALLDHLRGLILERRGRVAEAHEAFRRYLDREPDGSAADEIRARLAVGEGR